MSGHSLLETIRKTVLIPPHPAGLPFIIGGVVAAFVLFFVADILAFIALVFSVFCLYFFRDPNRMVPQKESLILAPADGLVSAIVEGVSLPPELREDGMDETASYTRVSTFLSVLDVHVNRVPVSGKVLRKVYSPGKFLNADLDKASEDNERSAVLIETGTGKRIAVVQIAGLIARRIVTEVTDGQSVRSGARYGIIRFGSRLDVYLPEGVRPSVCVGQRAIGGETIFADIDSSETSFPQGLLM